MATKRSTSEPASPVLSKRILVPATNEGQVGKSFFSVNLVHWLKNHPAKLTVAAFDPDSDKPSMRTLHPDAHLVNLTDMTDLRDIDKIVLQLAQADVSVVDGVAGVFAKAFDQWSVEVDFPAQAQAIGAALTYYVVYDNNPEHLPCLQRALERIPPEAHVLVVLNYRSVTYPPTSPLRFWEGSVYQEAYRRRGATELRLPKLDTASASFALAQRQPIGVMAANGPSMGINSLDHARFTSYCRKLHGEFERAAHLLLPPALIGKLAAA